MWCVYLRGRVGTSVEVVLFGDVSAYIPQVDVVSTSLGALPRPVPRPLPGVTLPASPECLSPLYWGWLWGGWLWSRSLTWGWSSVWAWVLALVGARCRGLCVGLLSRPLPGVTPPASPECSTPQCWGWLLGGRRVACVWPWPVPMACVIRVFDVVVVSADRSVGCPGGRCRC